MRLVSDMAAAVAVYEQHGFRGMPTDGSGCVGLYIWVDSLADVASGGAVLGEMTTAYGTRERYVREDSGLVAYAETISF